MFCFVVVLVVLPQHKKGERCQIGNFDSATIAELGKDKDMVVS